MPLPEQVLCETLLSVRVMEPPYLMGRVRDVANEPMSEVDAALGARQPQAPAATMQWNDAADGPDKTW